MFEKLKLNLYKNKIIGFAYDYDIHRALGVPVGVECNIYLVTISNNKYKYIEFSKIYLYNQEEVNAFAAYIEKYNINYRSKYENEEETNKENIIISREQKDNVLKLVKKIPPERRESFI